MNDDQITALAREYGECVANSLDYDMCTDPELRHKLVAKGHSESAQLVLEWLSSRFCLVGKEAVRKQFKSAKRLIEARNYNKQCIGVGSRGVLERLFPEIAKEVE
jgi:hypothetical protein